MKLSVIMPVYNVEAWLLKCLDSIIYPELTDYEIICVNDGSTDCSGDIAMAYAERYPGLVRVICQENGGPGAARNTGIEAARGEFLLFVDSDDYLSENALPEIFEALRQDLDICVFDFYSVNSQGDILKQEDGCCRDGRFELADCPQLLLARPEAWNKIYRRSLFIESGVRFPSQVWFEDLRTTPKLFLEAGSIGHARKTWYNYLSRPGSIMNSKQTERNLEIIDAIDDLTAYYRQRGAYEKYRAELEYIRFYNQFLTSSVRVILTDTGSPVQDRLREDFLEKCPDYAENPYVKKMSVRHKLLTRLLLSRKYRAVERIMRLNAAAKRRE